MPHWVSRELDSATADAVALMTLYVGASDRDDAQADRLLTELLNAPDGALKTIQGLESLCAALMILIELDTGQTPETTLRRVGQLAAGYSGSINR
jgi:uncharacterized protein YjeT (DUF2065 family)